MLCSGKANITHEEEMLEIIELAKQLGIDMENSETDFSKPVDVLRSDSSEKKRRRRNRKQVINLDEFCFFNEEDPLVSLQNSTAIDSLTVEKSTDIQESEKEPHVQEVVLDSNENTPEEFEMSVKIEESNQSQTHEVKFTDQINELTEIIKDEDVAINPLKPRKNRPKMEKNLECEYCEERFAYELNLNKHKRIHIEEKPYGCTDCGEKFAKKTSLKLHRANKNKRFKCDVCGFAFGVYSALKIHKLTHLAEKPFQCEICPKQFIQHTNLVKHIEIYMSIPNEEHKEMEEKKLNKKQFQCDVCAIMLSSRKSVRTHKISVHSEVKPFNCGQCNKAFPVVASLNVHNRIYHKGFRRQKTRIVLTA